MIFDEFIVKNAIAQGRQGGWRATVKSFAYRSGKVAMTNSPAVTARHM